MRQDVHGRLRFSRRLLEHSAASYRDLGLTPADILARAKRHRNDGVGTPASYLKQVAAIMRRQARQKEKNP